MGKIYQVAVIGFKSERLTVDLCNTEEQFKSMTVLQLKEKIKQKRPAIAEAEGLRLIFAANGLDDDAQTLSHYGIQHLSVIQLVLRVPGGLMA